MTQNWCELTIPAVGPFDSSVPSVMDAELIDELPGLLDEPDLRIEAIRAVAAFEQEDLGRLLMTRYDGLNADEKNEVIQTLASRPVYGWLLTDALKQAKAG